jgi:hypothetical protein
MTTALNVHGGVTALTRYLNRAEVAALLGVGPATVTEYRRRYAATATPFPLPDMDLAGHPGWSEARAAELLAWAASRPGRTGRPRKGGSQITA